MRIFADDVVCHGNYGTIYKLVIILVLFDKAKMIIGILAQYIRRMKHYLYETKQRTKRSSMKALHKA